MVIFVYDTPVVGYDQRWAEGLGWMISTVPIVLGLLIGTIFVLRKQKGTFKEVIFTFIFSSSLFNVSSIVFNCFFFCIMIKGFMTHIHQHKYGHTHTQKYSHISIFIYTYRNAQTHVYVQTHAHLTVDTYMQKHMLCSRYTHWYTKLYIYTRIILSVNIFQEKKFFSKILMAL